MATQQVEKKTPEKAQASQGMVVKYKVEGIDLTLTENMVKQFLVRGNNQLITRQEIIFFLGICQARMLNPLAGDCYLVKYGQDPAAIITSIDYFRARARKNPDCRGWRKGVIVQKEDGTLRDSAGLVLEGEKLVGGWFEATPEGWNVPTRVEVNLSGYIKKTNQGGITKFWSPENQPTMIAKVAESQGLRSTWPREFGKLYTADEMGVDEEAPPTIEMGPGGEVLGTVELFMDLAKEKTGGNSKLQASLFKYVVACADHYKADQDQIKRDASLQFDKFWENFERWLKQASQAKPQGQAKAPEKETPKDTPKGDPALQAQWGGQEATEAATEGTVVDDRPDKTFIACPQETDGSQRALGYCRSSCPTSFECEKWRA